MGLDNYIVTAAPTITPVTLQEVKTWCRITTCSEDDMLIDLINSATAKAELFTNRVFITRSYTGYFECMECDYRYDKGPYFHIRRAPLINVATVKVYVSDVLTTIEDTEYNIKLTAGYGFSKVVFEVLNDDPDLIPYPYQIAFTAGYGATAADVPYPIKLAIKMMVAYWYQQRGDCDGSTEIPITAKGILGEYRILNTYG